MKSYSFMGLAVCLLLVSACQRRPIEDAVKGALPPAEENVVVQSYCQSCHVHEKFREAPHLERVRLRYDENSPLRAAARCLECHVVRPETFFRGEGRMTRFPHGTLVDIADIPRPEPAAQLKRQGGAGPAPEREAPAPAPAKKKKRRWYFLYLF